MTILLIAHDLVDAETRQNVIARIRAIGYRWARPLADVWYVDTELAPEAVQVQFADLLGIDDGLVVQRVGCDAVGYNTSVRWTRSTNDRDCDQGRSGQIIPWPRQPFADAA